MIVGVMADTHDNLLKTEFAIRELESRGAEFLLHAGDLVAPFALKVILSSGIPFIGVLGNNDGEVDGLKRMSADIHESPHRFELDGRVIVMGHDPDKVEDIVEPDDELVVCGHTHQPRIEMGPPLRVNPGETGGWLTGRCSAALVDLRKMTAELVDLGEQKRPECMM
jgi:putative phosphoesterase